MAVYMYSSKLSEASCSSRCPMRIPPTPSGSIPKPPPLPEHAPIVANPALLRPGKVLDLYDDNFYMKRRNKYGNIIDGVNYISTQKVDIPQVKAYVSTSLAMPVVKTVERCDVEYDNGEITTATMEALIDMLRPGASKTFKFTFLLCARLFLRPHELLAKICKKHFRSYRKKEEEKTDPVLIQEEIDDMVSLVSIFTEWTVMFPYDFRDDRVMALVRVMSERCSIEYMQHLREIMSTTLETLLDKLTDLEAYEESHSTILKSVSAVEDLSTEDVLTLGLTPVALAAQLTVVEHYYLSYIGPEEFVQSFTLVPDTPTYPNAPAAASIRLHHVESKSTRNLEAYADWFNRLSLLVATDVVKGTKSRYRGRVIEQWVMTARECFNVGNFNSLMAIVGALNMLPVTRLKKTWARTTSVCGQQLRQLELCINPASNHGRYRAALTAAPTVTAVPLLSITCRDLHFVNQSGPSKIGMNRVNFEKWSAMARFVDSQLARRGLTAEQPPAPPAPPQHTPVWHYLHDSPTFTQQALELVSFEREPPMDNLEKERLKRLRGGS